jgi:hypothetical protein
MKIRNLYSALAIFGVLFGIASCNNTPKKQTDTKTADVWSIEKAKQ